MPALHRLPHPRLRFGADARSWRDWRWQQRRVLRGPEELAQHLQLTPEELEGFRSAAPRFPVQITPYYLSLADPDDPWCPVRMQIVPRPQEARVGRGELRDPLGEDRHRPVAALVHRYPDRALLLVTDRCSVHCRHCTRRRWAGGRGGGIQRRQIEEALAYVRAHPEIHDVILSGGDPLLLDDGAIERLVSRLRAIPHVQLIRIGTRMPVSNPMRITTALARALRRHAPVYVVTHFNHPKECTPEAAEACSRLVDAGVPVENQTVLLRRVNSSARVMIDLCQRLLAMRVRPYYLHQMDVAQGLEHLRTPIETGVEILRAMRGRVSGLAIPHLAVDLPGGGGKVTLQPDYVVSRDASGAVLKSWRGTLHRYPQPVDGACDCPYEAKYYGLGD